MPFTRPVAGMPVTVEDFGQPVYDMIQPTAWTNIAFATGWTSGVFARYRKIGDRVEFAGELQSTQANAANSTVTTMPVGFRPAANYAWVCPLYDGTLNDTWVQINPSGIMSVSKNVTASGHNVQIVTVQYATTS